MPRALLAALANIDSEIANLCCAPCLPPDHLAGAKGQRVEAEPGLFAAVTAGLKAKVLLPSELIRFKEQLKKRAGKEDYLAAR